MGALDDVTLSEHHRLLISDDVKTQMPFQSIDSYCGDGLEAVKPTSEILSIIFLFIRKTDNLPDTGLKIIH